MKPNCTSKIINNYDVKTCKTKILNLRSDCSFKRNIKPPFKVGWHKKYLVCNKKIPSSVRICLHVLKKVSKFLIPTFIFISSGSIQYDIESSIVFINHIEYIDQ